MEDKIIEAVIATYKEVTGGQYPDVVSLTNKLHESFAGINYSNVAETVERVNLSSFDIIRTGNATNPNQTKFMDTLKGKVYKILGGEE